jgi:hypothetical protein
LPNYRLFGDYRGYVERERGREGERERGGSRGSRGGRGRKGREKRINVFHISASPRLRVSVSGDEMGGVPSFLEGVACKLCPVEAGIAYR